MIEDRLSPYKLANTFEGHKVELWGIEEENEEEEEPSATLPPCNLFDILFERKRYTDEDS